MLVGTLDGALDGALDGTLVGAFVGATVAIHFLHSGAYSECACIEFGPA